MRTKSDKTATFQTRCSPEQKQALATYWESLSAGGSPSPQPMSQKPVKAKEQPLNPAPSELQKELDEAKANLAQWQKAFDVQLKEIERLSDESYAARKEAQELRETGGTERQTKYIQVLLSKLAKYETPAQQGIDQERA